MVDWQKIKTEYITTDTSYRKLGEKYGVNYSVIGAKARTEGWVDERTQYRNKTYTKTIEKISETQAKRASKVSTLADKLLIKVEQAIDELDRTMVTHKTKTREIQYGDSAAPGKPTKEVIHEEEELCAVNTVVDRLAVRQLTAALRDLQAIKGELTDLERREREARIDALRRSSMTGDGDDDDTGVIIMPPRAEVISDE